MVQSFVRHNVSVGKEEKNWRQSVGNDVVNAGTEATRCVIRAIAMTRQPRALVYPDLGSVGPGAKHPVYRLLDTNSLQRVLRPH